MLRPLLRRPALVGLAAAALSPGGHLLLSTQVERRRVGFRQDYPAVLVGDPLLALAAALCGRACRAQVLSSPMLRRGPLLALTAGAVGFGAWQARDEVRRGVYTREQMLSPSKLWHQFVVYPGLSTLVLSTVGPAGVALLRGEVDRSRRPEVLAAGAGVALWAALTLEGIVRPRSAHTAYIWRRPQRPWGARQDAARTG